MLPSISLANGLNNGSSMEYQIITETRGEYYESYKVPLSSLEGNSYSSLSADTTNQISFFIENVFHVSEYEVEISYKASNDYYNTLWDDAVISIDTLDTGTRVTIYDLDWQTADTYNVIISTDDAIYVDQVTQSDVGSEIALAVDNTYVPVQVDIPFALNNLTVQHLVLHYLDENGIPIGAGYANIGTLVPSGSYNIQVTAHDDGHAYGLFKKGYVLDTTNSTINFLEDEVSEIVVNMTNTTTTDIALDRFSPLHWDGFNSLVSVSVSQVSNLESLYVSKLNYKFYLTYMTSDDWTYRFNTGNIDATNNKTINLDTNLHAYVSMNQASYEPAQTLYLSQYSDDHIGIYDGNGNALQDVGNNHYTVPAIVELVNKVDAAEVYTIPVDYLGYPKITLPDTTGTFTMTFKLEEGPLSVVPATSAISIGTDGGSGSEPFTPDLNGDGRVDIFDLVKAAKQNPAVLKEILNHLRN
jgi:hypothetical protein